MSGAVGAQKLNCAVPAPGSLAVNATFTAVVTAVTSVGQVHDDGQLGDASATNALSVSDTGHLRCQTPVLQIAKTPDSGTITAGDTATFTIVITNLGPGIATGVTLVDDPLPAGGGVTWTTSTTGCTVSGAVGSQKLNCAVPAPGSLAVNGTFTAVVTAVTSVGKCTIMDNSATASATNALSVSDTGHIVCQTPILQIAKTPDSGTITAGDTATFTIVVTNNGPGTATGVTLVDDPLPAGGGVTWATLTPDVR